MRVFVFTYDRYETITTSRLLGEAGVQHELLCHSPEAKALFLAAGRLAGPIEATGEPKGLSYNRNAALERMREGEWALFLVDDLNYVCELEGYDRERQHGKLNITLANQSAIERRLMHRVGLAQFLQRCEELTTVCDKVGAHLGGFSSYKNPLFRAKHIVYNNFVDGRAYIVRKTHLRFDEHVHMMDDMSWTALNIEAFGATVVNRWILPSCSRYTKGSYGSMSDRMEAKRAEVSYLLKRHPRLIRLAKKKGWPTGTHVALRHRKVRGAGIRPLF